MSPYTPAPVLACMQALRTCPVCRTTTHFITPSTVWPDTAEEKERIVNGGAAYLRCTLCMLCALPLCAVGSAAPAHMPCCTLPHELLAAGC